MDIKNRFQRAPRQHELRSLALQSVRELENNFLTGNETELPEWAVTAKALAESDCQVAAVGLEVLLSHCGEHFTASEMLLVHALAVALRNQQFSSVIELSRLLSTANPVLGIQSHVCAA